MGTLRDLQLAYANCPSVGGLWSETEAREIADATLRVLNVVAITPQRRVALNAVLMHLKRNRLDLEPCYAELEGMLKASHQPHQLDV